MIRDVPAVGPDWRYALCRWLLRRGIGQRLPRPVWNLIAGLPLRWRPLSERKR